MCISDAAKLKNNELPTLSKFLEYLKEKAIFLELNSRVDDPRRVKYEKHVSHNTMVKKVSTCIFCGNGVHALSKWYKFTGVPVNKRFEFLKSKHMCFNCLKHHKGTCSLNSSCNTCGKKHHSLLHLTPPSTNEGSVNNKLTKLSTFSSSEGSVLGLSKNNELGESSKTSVTAQTLIAPVPSDNIMLMATALAYVVCNYKLAECRDILNNVSEKNFISSNCIQKFGIASNYGNWIIVGGVGGITTSVNRCAQLKIKSKYNNFEVESEFGILPRVSDDCPKFSFPKNSVRWPSFILYMLIGIDLFYKLLLKGKINLGINKPTLQETTFGWIVVGPLDVLMTNSSKKIQLSSCLC